MFNIVDGVAIDYMHGVLLGVQKQLLELWFSSKHSNQPYNFHSKVCEVDKRLQSITPTLDITRLPRSIEHELPHWKASEYRSFLLFYGAPVLNGILDHTRFSHYLLFVDSIHILLKCGSTQDEITSAENMLINFCRHMGNLYNINAMRLNVHQLLHLPESVRNLGPLYTHSCFSFEDKNGFVMKMIRGTQSIDNQIVTGVSFVQKLPELIQKFVEKDPKMETLYHALESPCLLKRNIKLGDGIYTLGGMSDRALSADETTALQSLLGYDPAMTKFPSFTRVLLHQDIIYGQAYSRMTKRDNSTISYTTSDDQEMFGQVKFFVQITDHDFDTRQTIALVEKLRCRRYMREKKIIAVTKSKDVEAVPLQNIMSCCMLVSFPGSLVSYVCRFPNNLESD